jgi:hypothetical protein
MISSFVFVCLIRNKNKRKKTIGQHLSGKQKQKKKTSDNTYQASKNKRKKPIGQHLSGKQKQKKKTMISSFVFVCLISVVRCFFSFVFVCLISVIR